MTIQIMSARVRCFLRIPLPFTSGKSRDIFSIDSPMQVIVLTKRTRGHDSTTQPELPNKKVQVAKVEEQDNSMVEVVKQPRQSK